ncbi:IscS subfamily cysteine desulfurase [Saccharibacillus alkalitolerans]|uniref:Aminotransferase class V-fold PLP-dependent enzyme n=1 Tax=Saccharibacillus alkalitolerans TaxID=2705290 RepID=A0ABX0FAJ4_9BACL|nr:IscS subfamily cysteine desulfurase [Saccharibacillus alkalitolerans]NGZ76499.1 aminotransferase class V-fold PLP-dependent enzyme [Saccharibacillus alkalitolerans]
MIYLDYAASSPLCEEALQTLMTMSRDVYANSNSLHDGGGHASHILERSREFVAESIGGRAEGLFFTSGGTESNLLAIQALAKGLPPERRHILTSVLEHHSVKLAFAGLSALGYEVDYIRPDASGRLTPQQIEPLLRPDTGLVSLQHANSETGLVQDLPGIGAFLHERGILLHTDAVQSFGKIRFSAEELGADAISISAHKVQGPKGVGAVYIRPGVPYVPVHPGSLHERGFRPGTVNVPGIAAFASAAVYTCGQLEERADRYRLLRRHLKERFREFGLSAYVVTDRLPGGEANVLPHIAGCAGLGYEGQYVMLECNRKGICISTGSACSSGQHAVPETLIALGLSEGEGHSFFRISFGPDTTTRHLDLLVRTLHELEQTK